MKKDIKRRNNGILAKHAILQILLGFWMIGRRILKEKKDKFIILKSRNYRYSCQVDVKLQHLLCSRGRFHKELTLILSQVRTSNST